MEPGGVLAVPAGRRYPAGAGGAILSAARPAATDRTTPMPPPPARIESLIRAIPDHPRAGILFRDVTPLMGDPAGLRAAVEAIAEPHSGGGIDKVAGIEARGFVFAAPAACRLGAGLVPIRKKGKLPGRTIARSYDLEYGSDVLEMHADAVRPGERVLLVDDLLATGGTAEAAAALVEEAGGAVVECCFVVDLPDVGGRARLEARGRAVRALCAFAGD